VAKPVTAPSPAYPRADANPAPQAAIAALRARPGFTQALRASAGGMAALYQGRHLLTWLMDDRGRLLFGYSALYLHLTRDATDPTSGLTPTRMKALCAELDICSAGRAGAMLSLMRFSGYLTPDIQVVDRRQRRLVATEKLFVLLRARWRLIIGAMAPLFEDGAAMLAALDDPVTERAFVIAMVTRFRAGFRPVHSAPALGLFGERNAGILILMNLVASGAADDTVPPGRPTPISIAALARRYAVSRPHVLKLIRDAGEEGFIERIGPDNSKVLFKPRLAEALENFFATVYLFMAACMREAMQASGRAGKDANRAAG
jgi:hypothetical protein